MIVPQTMLEAFVLGALVGIVVHAVIGWWLRRDRG